MLVLTRQPTEAIRIGDGKPLAAREYRCSPRVKEHRPEGWQFVLLSPVKPGINWLGDLEDGQSGPPEKPQAAPYRWRELIGEK